MNNTVEEQTSTIKEKIYKHIDKWSDDDMAEIFYLLAKDRFKIYFGGDPRVNYRIYEFVNGIWKYRKNEISMNMYLKKKVTEAFIEVYDQINNEIKSLITDMTDDSSKSRKVMNKLMNKRKHIEYVFMSLKDDKKKRHVINASLDYFRDDDFLKDLIE